MRSYLMFCPIFLIFGIFEDRPGGFRRPFRAESGPARRGNRAGAADKGFPGLEGERHPDQAGSGRKDVVRFGVERDESGFSNAPASERRSFSSKIVRYFRLGRRRAASYKSARNEVNSSSLKSRAASVVVGLDHFEALRVESDVEVLLDDDQFPAHFELVQVLLDFFPEPRDS